MVSTRSSVAVSTKEPTTPRPVATAQSAATGLPTPSTLRKRKLEAPSTPRPSTKRKYAAPAVPVTPSSPSVAPAQIEPVSFREEDDVLPPTLTFDLEEAKKHLIEADSRFEDVFARLPCKPFEVLEVVHPFRTLASSILGQQISWLAARSITAKFLHLFDPSLPATADGTPSLQDRPFPDPSRLVGTDAARLRMAGLSGRKAEYVLDLAARFADGRLSARRLREADDEEMARMLIEVYGIGRWTVDMFAIFSARRPNIMPYGDLGVQRGLLRWTLASHDPAYRLAVEPLKLPQPTIEVSPTAAEAIKPAPTEQDVSALPPIPPADTTSAVPATPKRSRGKKAAVPLPTPQTPSSSALASVGAEPISPAPAIARSTKPVELPDGLTVAALKARLAGKKIKKGLYLTPEEMDALTEKWEPYRSIGVWYMWALSEENS